jgi:hypothetical protein
VQACVTPQSENLPIDWLRYYRSLTDSVENLKGSKFGPGKADKTPLIGPHSMTDDLDTLERWWGPRGWQYAEIDLMPGPRCVIVDIDRKAGGNGWIDFHEIDGRHPLDIDTPGARTPSAGLHLFFDTCGTVFGNGTHLFGCAIDVRAHRYGYAQLPSHMNGRHWEKPLTGPWAPAPNWLKEWAQRQQERKAEQTPNLEFAPNSVETITTAPGYRGDTALGLATLRGCCGDIRNAECGEQRGMLNRKGAKIGALIFEGELGPHVAHALHEAGMAMTNFDPARPWTSGQIVERVLGAIRYGYARAARSNSQTCPTVGYQDRHRVLNRGKQGQRPPDEAGSPSDSRSNSYYIYTTNNKEARVWSGRRDRWGWRR